MEKLNDEIIDTFEPDVIKKLILKNEKKIFKQHPEEKYRSELLDRKDKYPIQDYINLKVPEISSKKELYLKTYLYPPFEKDYPTPRGLVFMFHGMGAYAGNTAHVAKYFAQIGLIVCSVDYRGYGFSEGKHGNIESIDYVINDMEIFMKESIEYFKNKYDDSGFIKNKFLCGISMGGLMCYHLSYKKPADEFKGIMFFCPAVNVRITFMQSLLLNVVSAFCPNVALPKPKKESLICKNPLYFENPDEVIKNTFTKLRTVNEIRKSSYTIVDRAGEYKTPFVIIVPGMDKLVPPADMYSFYEKASSKDKEIWYYGNCWHAIYIENEILEVMPRLQKWADKRL
jgi:acylglycerol lipase